MKIPKVALAPFGLTAALMCVAAIAIGSTATWITLTVAGFAMGLIIFVTASGLTLIFGLMDVLHFGHGLFIAIGAYVATSVLRQFGWMAEGDSMGPTWLLLALAAVAAVILASLIGVIFERLIVRPVYGDHLKQILITMGGMIIGTELLKAVWGVDELALPLPGLLRGAFQLYGASIEKYRVAALLVGLSVFLGIWSVLNRTKIGLLIQAGVEDKEMVESLGYPIRRIFVWVFVAGSGLAGLGGVLWGLYQQSVTPQIGSQLNVLIFIVIIIGGLGSTGGALLGAILVGLVANYTGFLLPKLALFSNIGLMIVVLLWRPRGLFSSSKS